MIYKITLGLALIASFSGLIAMEGTQTSPQRGLMFFNLSKLPAKFAAEDKPEEALAVAKRLPASLLNYKDTAGKTVLDYATEKGYKDLEQYLISKGAKRGS